MQCYMALNRNYTISNYLTKINNKDTENQPDEVQTQQAQSGHRGRQAQTDLLKEDRLCSHYE